MVREDLNPVEQARACAALVEDLGMTREAVGLRVGRSRAAISNLLRLLDLPDEALELLRVRRAQRRPRAGAAAGRGPRRAPPAGSRRGRERLVGARAGVARALGQRRALARRRRVLHPDQEEASARASDALGAALGRDVAVRPHGTGYRATVQFASADEALELAAQLAAGGAPDGR